MRTQRRWLAAGILIMTTASAPAADSGWLGTLRRGDWGKAVDEATRSVAPPRQENRPSARPSSPRRTGQPVTPPQSRSREVRPSGPRETRVPTPTRSTTLPESLTRPMRPGARRPAAREYTPPDREAARRELRRLGR